MQYISWTTSVLVFVIGIVFGSFLNVVVFRIHQKKSFFNGRSHCMFCRHQLKWYELVPLFSFLVQKGSCRSCKKPISWQYPLVELSTGVLFVAMLWSVMQGAVVMSPVAMFTVLMYWVFICFLIVLFIYDLRWQILPDIVSFPAMGITIILQIILAILIGYFGELTIGTEVTSYLVNAGWGVLIGGGFFLFQFVISRGRWIGGGDIRFGVLMGLILGWEHTVVALMVAYMIGALFAIGLVVSKNRKWSSQIPFGTFLALATIIVLLWGEHIVEWYFSYL